MNSSAANGCDITALSGLESSATVSALDSASAAATAATYISDGLPADGASVTLGCAADATFLYPWTEKLETLTFTCSGSPGSYVLSPALPATGFPIKCVDKVKCEGSGAVDDANKNIFSSTFEDGNEYIDGDTVT